MLQPGTDDIIAFLVFPLADLRHILSPGSEVIDQPFLAKDSEAFLRRFGHGMYRLQQRGYSSRVPPALEAAENWFVCARRFLRVYNAPIPPRVFADGLISARLEVTLVLAKSTTREPVKDWLKRLLDQRAEVRSSRAGKRSPMRHEIRLGEVSRHFRDAYLAATTSVAVRRQAREHPESEAAALIHTTQRFVRCLEPLILLVMPPSFSTAPGLEQRVGVVPTRGASFRLMTLYPDQATDLALIRLARRSFIRLLTECRAIQELTQFWSREPPSIPAPRPLVQRLEAFADRLHDTSAALSDQQGGMIPLLGELAPELADAWRKLGGWLDETYPDAGRKQRRLAEQLLRTARDGSTVNVNIDGIIGVQGPMNGGWVTPILTHADNILSVRNMIMANNTTYGISGGTFYGPNQVVNNAMNNVSQTIGALPNTNQTTRDELTKLAAQLHEDLQKLSTEKPDRKGQIDDVAAGTEDLMAKAKPDQPNRTLLQRAVDFVKSAAEALNDVAPSVLSTVKAIAGIIATLHGL
jgi:hypothetical protein